MFTLAFDNGNSFQFLNSIEVFNRKRKMLFLPHCRVQMIWILRLNDTVSKRKIGGGVKWRFLFESINEELKWSSTTLSLSLFRTQTHTLTYIYTNTHTHSLTHTHTHKYIQTKHTNTLFSIFSSPFSLIMYLSRSFFCHFAIWERVREADIEKSFGNSNLNIGKTWMRNYKGEYTIRLAAASFHFIPQFFIQSLSLFLSLPLSLFLSHSLSPPLSIFWQRSLCRGVFWFFLFHQCLNQPPIFCSILRIQMLLFEFGIIN